jgi:CDP-diacylglycerol--glycerol-3-phosphate 3-phosphatidyltransferase
VYTPPGKKKPLITANMVTLARLLPMPVVSWWIYQGWYDTERTSLWLALIVGTLIGCTDFVDGYMARKQGPTVFGGLLDPIADKVFVAFTYMPFADVGLVPAWAVALMFVRECLVTALRSAYEQRRLSLKTSYLAKAKTWTQMQGIGMLVLFPLVGPGGGMKYAFWFGLLAPIVAAGVFWLVRKKFWPGAVWMSLTFAVLLAIHYQGDHQQTANACMGMIVLITWISGLGYIVGGWDQLRRAGDFNRSDAVRLVGSVVLPLATFAALAKSPSPAWPIIAVLAVELAAGGLDNLLSHHQRAASAGIWGSRVLGASLLLVTAVLLPDYAAWLTMGAAAVSMAGVAWEFWRGRDYYLDARIREKARRDNHISAAQPSDGTR